MRSMTCAGLRPPHGPLNPPALTHRATAPATCGAAMLVPDIVAVPPPSLSDLTHTPGADTMCTTSCARVAKLEKPAALSSAVPDEQLGDPPCAPGTPSLSPKALTVRTSGNVAGTTRSVAAMSRPSLPAATTKLTPAVVARQIAARWGSVTQLPTELASPPRLMLATLMSSAAAFAVTQSMPQMTDDVDPEPVESSTLTA